MQIRNDLTPKYDPAIDRWLHAFGGTHSDELMDWLAQCPDLSQPLPVLDLCGAPGTGKSLLTHGLGRLWTSEFGKLSRLDRVLGSGFNTELERNPIVFGDEWPAYIEPGLWVEIAKLASRREHEIRIKCQPSYVMARAVRVIVASNVSGIGIRKALSLDISAEVREALPDRPTLFAWADDGIAQHVLAVRDLYARGKELLAS